jgi:hypothetical protein
VGKDRVWATTAWKLQTTTMFYTFHAKRSSITISE